MPTVRLSGKTLSANESVERALRAKLLFLIYNAGWDINNASGKEQITLSNIEKKIIESDCFVFTPGASLEDLFKAVSIFVGYQTIDQNLSGKPTVILNSDASWDPLFDVLSHLGGTTHRIRDPKTHQSSESRLASPRDFDRSFGNRRK